MNAAPPRTPNGAPPGGQRSAWVVGGSGLVGRALIDVLVEAPEYARVLAVTRRPLGREHPRLANRITPFDRLEAQLAGTPCQDAFCCLGTTLRQAGSEAAFRAVDHDEVLRFARVARKAGAERFVVVSVVGADPAAKNFYLRVKGETEADLATLGFPSLDIAQPALLLGGSRPDARPLETTARLFMPLANPFLGGSMKSYRGIDVSVLARAMLAMARSGRRGVRRHTYVGLRKLAARVAGPGS